MPPSVKMFLPPTRTLPTEKPADGLGTGLPAQPLMLALRTLIIRVDVEMSSTEVGRVNAGTTLTVFESRYQPDGS